MTTKNGNVWRVKLAAWLHDPAEKALILYRSVGGHEAGTVAKLYQLCFGAEELDSETKKVVKLADHWASAADRPSLPKPKADRFVGDKVLFWGREGAEIIHPLAGDRYNLPNLYIDRAGFIEDASFRRLAELIPGRPSGRLDPDDFKKTFLSLWRLGPDSPPDGLDLGKLWKLLPADTRIPDHSIWEHLALTSAFAGAMAGDGETNPALLAVNLGPVQGFIAQARTVSDLWAGSHFLARLSWEAMKVVCEAYGPDAVIFPNLWGVPIVDQWLREEGVDIPQTELEFSKSDANPLFSAALPNRFVALVPASAAQALAEKITIAVRNFAVSMAESAAMQVLGIDQLPETMKDQIRGQMQAFPEVHWSTVPWKPLVDWDEKGGIKPQTKIESTANLETLAGELLGIGKESQPPGFLGTDHWKLLRKTIEYGGAGPKADDPFFFVPNPGVLYPALYEILDRLLAAAKATRRFGQKPEKGYRCSLCGEREWLSDSRDDLEMTPGQRKETCWAKIGEGAIARKGEHLCAWCTLKRGWPRIFSAEVKESLGMKNGEIDRYVVSTHAMALSASFQRLADEMMRGSTPSGLGSLREYSGGGGRVALPRKLHRTLTGNPLLRELNRIARTIPGVLDDLRDDPDGADDYEKLQKELKDFFGHRPEAYYAWILFDGDSMGAWISGTDDTLKLKLRYEDTWHKGAFSEVAKYFSPDSGAEKYMESKRAPSPARHVAISQALNNFSLYAARWVVEDLFLGKLIYSGGDDVLAMVSVDDLLPCLLTLRCAYSGTLPVGDKEAAPALLGVEDYEHFGRISRGHILLDGKGDRLLRMMGGKATASAGAVVAHHTAPLQGVLRELRAAESRAKNEGGRNAFSISLMKRAGGTTHLTSGWGFGGASDSGDRRKGVTAVGVLHRLSWALASEGVSRRAAYSMLQWLPDLPENPDAGLPEEQYRGMLTMNIAHQLKRQGYKSRDGRDAGILADALVELSLDECRPAEGGAWSSVTAHLQSMLTVGEFFAREGRTLGDAAPGKEPEKGA